MANSITSKGQVTIPKAIRDRLGLKPGDKVEFTENAQGEVTVAAIDAAPTEAAAYRERLRALRKSAPVGPTTDEILRMTRGDDWTKP